MWAGQDSDNGAVPQGTDVLLWSGATVDRGCEHCEGSAYFRVPAKFVGRLRESAIIGTLREQPSPAGVRAVDWSPEAIR